MKKLRYILQAVAFLLIGIPIMIMASIMDQRAFKKEREQRQKAQERSK
jgi:heme exporter protein D